MRKRLLNIKDAGSSLLCKTDNGRTGQKRSRTENILPKRFLLGGTIDDPLNLHSLAEEPVRSDIVSRDQIVNVIVPRNIKDPLNLNDDLTNKSTLLHINTQSQTNWKNAVTTVKLATENELASPVSVSSLSHHEIELDVTHSNYDKNKNGGNQMHHSDRIVSPAVPQFSVKRKKHRGQNKKAKTLVLTELSVSVPNKDTKSKPAAKKYSSGNYPAYYGYRNFEKSADPRLELLSREMFEGKDVLDIGCNSGHVTLSVARDFAPRQILGLDVDARLVESAKRNVRNFVCKSTNDTASYPNSMKSLYGPVSVGVNVSSDVTQATPTVFPHNVLFQVSDYVLGSNDELDLQRSEYDIILALSVTKWIHLNHGDDGLRRAFCRMIRQLRPSGKLILEAQPWSSYKRKKKLTEKISAVYQSIKFFPDQFIDYLLSANVGFVTCELLGTPSHKSKGFQRPVYVLTKSSIAESA